jgi:hemolysin III
MSANKTEYKTDQSLGEEIANSISHGIGALGGIVVTPFLIVEAIPYGTTAVVGSSIFATTIIILYLSSTLYHAFPISTTKKIFQVFDHSAIYLLIAGTYTPFTLGVLKGAWGWTIFGLMWSLALLGIVIKSIVGARKSALSTWLYVGMGWMGVMAIKPLWNNMEKWGLIWLLAGGLFYSFGVLFYIAKNWKYTHFIWHLFVLGGTACHVVAVMKYAN